MPAESISVATSMTEEELERFTRSLSVDHRRALRAFVGGIEPIENPLWVSKSVWRGWMARLKVKGLLHPAPRGQRHRCTPLGLRVVDVLQRPPPPKIPDWFTEAHREALRQPQGLYHHWEVISSLVAEGLLIRTDGRCGGSVLNLPWNVRHIRSESGIALLKLLEKEAPHA
jgi:hypothetical protein